MRRCCFVVIMSLQTSMLFCNIEMLSYDPEQFNERQYLGFYHCPNKYWFYNLFDSDYGTCAAEGVINDGSGVGVATNTNGVYFYKKEMKYGYYFNKTGFRFNIGFKNAINIDKMEIASGFSKSKVLFYANNRPKEIEIIFGNNKGLIFVTNIMLIDMMGPQEIELNKLINDVKYFSLGILSTYLGNKHNDTCISEIEFWNGDQKYQIANLEEAKKEFIVKYREKRENDVIALLATACSIEFIESKKAILDRWKKLGIPVDRVGIRRINGIETSYLEFTGKKGDFGGAMRIVGKSGNMRRGRDGEWFYLTDYIELGQWKVDEGGIIWIKVGNGEWKRNTGIFFEGTDIGKLAKIFPEG